MTSFVLSVLGNDRAGLVEALAEVVAAHGGDWGRSHMAQLGGKFAGLVLVGTTIAVATATARRGRGDDDDDDDTPVRGSIVGGLD